MARSPTAPCPCGSGRSYKRCCLRYLAGRAPAPSPEALMRSRYSAYAVGAVDYLISTTDPDGPLGREDRDRWAAEIAQFCQTTRFAKLTVRASEHPPGADRGVVEFHARLVRGDEDVSFAERSVFRLVDGRWLYHDGEVALDDDRGPSER